MSAVKQTPVSSPVSASTSGSTPVVDPSAPASPLVGGGTPTPLGGTTGKKFSVEKYYELQDKKLELKAKQRAEAAKPGSPKLFRGYSIEDDILVDYEDGELEDEGSSSSRLLESPSPSKHPRSESDAVPSGLETLAITSKQRDATRTDDTVREPWMPSERVIKDRYGAIVAPNPLPLYVDNRIVDDAEAAVKHLESGQIRGGIITSRSFTSSGIGARRRLRDEAKCPSGRHFAKAGRSLRTLTTIQQVIASGSLPLVSAS
ncbi:hypothetical protein PHMEG_00039804 [Phytophthora megakarya]|uniref:Uncharacterized protein n=1 Tax=Phytophthora megakarya TaxID=4795 RepID=A0A225UF36_9STRA|nr:hypothetical protein PHMEG_00039804 [Phytophthora megakarya]